MEPNTHSPTTFFQTCLGVFQGGGCRAAAFAGAYEDAVAHGVHFAEVAGASAGSIAAALIGAGASPAQLKESISQLDFKSFMVSPDPLPRRQGGFQSWSIENALKVLRGTRLKQLSYFYSYLGMHSSLMIEKWVEQELKKLLPAVVNRPVRFSDLLIPTWIIATDLKTGEVVTWSSSAKTSDAEVAQAVRASCSIPVFFQPVLNRYVDGGMLSNLPSFVFFNPNERPLSSRILAFALKAEGDEPELSTAFGVGTAMINAIVDGSQELQTKIQRGVHIISIPTGNIKATDFDKMNKSTIDYLVKQGRDATHLFFENELQKVQTEPPPSTVCRDNDERYSAITESLDSNVYDIIIVEKNTEWVYSLFPSLLIWRMNGARIRVLLTQTEEYMDHGAYRRRLLCALGAEVQEVPSVPERAYLFDSNLAERASAVMGLPSSLSAGRLAGIRYKSFYDFALIDAFRKQIEGLWPAATGGAAVSQIKLERIDRQALIDALRKGVRQYDLPGVEISVESIPINNLIFLTRYIKEYKYRQIRHLMALYQKNNVEWFEPAVVNFGQGQRSLVVPPVVEESGGEYVLIQGETRAVFCRDNGIPNIQGVVVRFGELKEPLPSDERIPIKGVRMTGREFLPQERFGLSFNRGLLRDIEKAAHPLDSLTQETMKRVD